MATTRKSAKAPAATPPAARKAAPAKATSKLAVKVAAKPATKAAAKPATRPAAAKSSPIPPAVKPVKAEKPRKPKLVRDSFTIPKAEYTVLDDLKQRAARLGTPAKKSEVLRAGIKALAAMSDVVFLSSLAAVPAIKTGRPKAG